MAKTALGKIEFTANQLKRFPTLLGGNIIGIDTDGGRVFIISKESLSDEDQKHLVDEIQKLPDEPMPKPASEQRLDDLRKKQSLTADEITEVLRIKKIL